MPRAAAASARNASSWDALLLGLGAGDAVREGFLDGFSVQIKQSSFVNVFNSTKNLTSILAQCETQFLTFPSSDELHAIDTVPNGFEEFLTFPCSNKLHATYSLPH